MPQENPGEPAQGREQRSVAQPIHEGEQLQELQLEGLSFAHAGPLPDPWTLARYREISPRAVEVILTMAENEQAQRHERTSREQAHSHKMEEREWRSAVNLAWGGLFSGVFLTLCICGLGGFLIYNDKDATGLTLIITNLVALIAIFVGARVLKPESKRKRDKSQREEQGDS